MNARHVRLSITTLRFFTWENVLAFPRTQDAAVFEARMTDSIQTPRLSLCDSALANLASQFDISDARCFARRWSDREKDLVDCIPRANMEPG